MKEILIYVFCTCGLGGAIIGYMKKYIPKLIMRERFLDEAQILMMRNEIIKFYNRHKHSPLTAFEYEYICDLKELYVDKLKLNSYCKKLCEEMISWEVE